MLCSWGFNKPKTFLGKTAFGGKAAWEFVSSKSKPPACQPAVWKSDARVKKSSCAWSVEICKELRNDIPDFQS